MLVVCKATPGCFFGPWPGEESRGPQPITLGEKPMSATQEGQTVQHADDTTFHNLVLESELPVLVDFYADWCGPCQRLAPVLEELAAENPSVRIVKVNVDHSPGLAAKYRIDSIPSVKVFKKGRIAEELVGLANKSQLRALLSL
jgi:thioredoxin 1